MVRNFFAQAGMRVPYPRSALAGGAIEIKLSRKLSVRRAHNYQELPYGSLATCGPITPQRYDPETVVRSLRKRLCRRLPMDTDPLPGPYTADGGLTLEGETNFLLLSQFVDKICAERIPICTDISDTLTWIQSLDHPQWRKDEFIAIFREYGGWETGWVPTKRQRQQVDAHTKLEAYQEFKEARQINSRSDAFKVFSGPAFKAIEDTVYSAFPEYFLKHLTDRQKHDRILALPDVPCHGTDFSAFESHMTPVVMCAIECRVYRHCLQRFPKLSNIICATIAGRNKIHHAKSGVSCTLYGRRMSGDMCTSLGNGLTNMMLALYLGERETGDYRCMKALFEGDDGLIVSPFPLTEAMYAALGFTIKIEHAPRPSECSFCQLVFATPGQSIKHFEKTLCEFGWTHSCIGAGECVRRELLRAKALSVCAALPHCPITRAVADRALQLTQGVRPRYQWDWYHRNQPTDETKLEPFAPTSETRALYAKLFGVPESLQLAVEGEIRKGTDLTSVLMPLLFHLKAAGAHHQAVTLIDNG